MQRLYGEDWRALLEEQQAAEEEDEGADVESKRFTCGASLDLVHRLRAACDAVAVGDGVGDARARARRYQMFRGPALRRDERHVVVAVVAVAAAARCVRHPLGLPLHRAVVRTTARSRLYRV